MTEQPSSNVTECYCYGRTERLRYFARKTSLLSTNNFGAEYFRAELLRSRATHDWLAGV